MRKRYIVLAVIVAACVGGQLTADPSSAVKFRAEIDAEVQKAKAERAVRETLLDGESARFRGLVTPNAVLVCGFVNAKNRFGGYVGDKAFMVAGRIVMLNDGSPGFANDWNKSCARKT